MGRPSRRMLDDRLLGYFTEFSLDLQVLLGAHALLANGNVMSRVGASQVRPVGWPRVKTRVKLRRATSCEHLVKGKPQGWGKKKLGEKEETES